MFNVWIWILPPNAPAIVSKYVSIHSTLGHDLHILVNGFPSASLIALKFMGMQKMHLEVYEHFELFFDGIFTRMPLSIAFDDDQSFFRSDTHATERVTEHHRHLITE